MGRMTGSLPGEVFLSHSSRNHSFATKLVNTIRAHNVPVWYSETNIVGAQQWHDEIGKALVRCDWFVVILSPSSVKSDWVKRELLFALNSPCYKDHIVPLMHRACDPVQLSWVLPQFQTVDFTRNYVAGCIDLLRMWGLAYRRS